MKLIARKKGWIGIDIGTSTVKVAQIVRRNDRLHLAARAIVPRPEPWPTQTIAISEPMSSASELHAAGSFLGDFRGRAAAAALSMAFCELHRLDQPPTSGIGHEQTVREAIEMATQSSSEPWQYDCWSAASTPAGPSTTNVLTAPITWNDQLCEDIAEQGWSCQLIDGLPLALARAVQLVHPHNSTAPTAALDLGFAAATFCSVINGQATYVRSLKNCGFERLLRSLSEQLDVTPDEAQRLLHKHGLCAEESAQPGDTVELIQELADDFLSDLVEQASRTLAHLKSQRESFVPERVYLLGGGATVKGLAPHLTRALQTKVQVWQYGDEDATNASGSGLPSCLLGSAIALSTLAWERP